MAVLSFILSSAAKHDVDSESLSSELQQLGLPKGSCLAFFFLLDCSSFCGPLRQYFMIQYCCFSSNVKVSRVFKFLFVIKMHLFFKSIYLKQFISTEHATGLCKSYEDKHSALQDKLRDTSLRCKSMSYVSLPFY